MKNAWKRERDAGAASGVGRETPEWHAQKHGRVAHRQDMSATFELWLQDFKASGIPLNDPALRTSLVQVPKISQSSIATMCTLGKSQAAF